MPERFELFTAAQVADLYGVDPKTVTRWAKQGKLQCIRTPGGHRRYPAAQFAGVLAVLRAVEQRRA